MRTITIFLALFLSVVAQAAGTLFQNYPIKTNDLSTNDLFLISDGSSSNRVTKALYWSKIRDYFIDYTNMVGTLPTNSASEAGVVPSVGSSSNSVWQADAAGDVSWQNAFTIDWSALAVDDTNTTLNLHDTVWRHTLTNNLNFSAATNFPTKSKTFYVFLSQDTTGGWGVTWDTNYFKWPAGTAPTITTNASSVDLITITIGPSGTNLLGVAVQNFQ
jgi:hypothetical protein